MRAEGDTEAADLLLVEDSPDDVLLTREALRDATFPTRLHVVEDGEAALAFMRREDEYAEAPRPDLILLDLNLPRLSGIEVLQALKSDPELKRIPVVVLTTSASERDVDQAYEEHVNAYVRKPLELDAFMQVVRLVDEYWLGVVTLPGGGDIRPDRSGAS